MVSKQTKIPKRAAVAVALVALVASSGLAIAGADAAADHLRPLMRGERAALEHGLSRGHTVALAVHVVAFGDDGDRAPVEGAAVTLYKLPRPPAASRPVAPSHGAPVDGAEARGKAVATVTTDASGVAVVEVRPGAYRVHVAHGGGAGSVALPVARDTRVGVLFDENGDAHFASFARRAIARHGETANLYVRVGHADADGHRGPLANATVTVLRVRPDGAGGHQLEPVANATTNPRGVATFTLHRGPYVVEVVRDDLNATARVPLRSDHGLLVGFDENGTARVRHRTPHGSPDGGAHGGGHVRAGAWTDPDPRSRHRGAGDPGGERHRG